MGTCFIADLHLSDSEPRKTGPFLRLLERAPEFEHLYILGDLFEFWLGDDAILPGQQTIVEAMAEAVTNGAKISIQPGNRDFLMGSQLESLAGITLIDDPHTIELHGQRLLLMHGDLLCQDDLAYQQLREQLRNPAWMEEFLQRPIPERIEMAKGLREQSRSETGQKSSDVMDVTSESVSEYLNESGARHLIHGHIHRQEHHTVTLDGAGEAERWVLGEWSVNGGPLLIADSNGLRFEAWRPQ